MRNFRNSLLVTLFGLFISMSVWASTNYAPLIEDIEQRLDKTAELYQQQHADEARRTVQMAYFEVFENLEGPIRINISARKSYEMESAFGEIRRMIGEKKPLADVQARIDWLKAALREVEPVLDGGHRLVAEEQHNALSRDDIAVHWQESFRTIDDLLAQAVTEYQAGNYSVASQHVHDHIRDHAHGDTFRDTVHEWHSNDADVSRNCFCVITEVDLGHGGHHHESNDHQSRSGSEGWNR